LQRLRFHTLRSAHTRQQTNGGHSTNNDHKKYCVRKRLKMKTLLGVKHLTRNRYYTYNFDLQNGFCALGIGQAERLLRNECARTSLPTRGATYRVVPIPLLLMQTDASLRELSTSAGSRKTMLNTRQLYEDLHKENAMARPEDFTLRRRLSIIRDYRGRGAHQEASLMDPLDLLRQAAECFLAPAQVGPHMGSNIDTA
jgi:hypothetical protein